MSYINCCPNSTLSKILFISTAGLTTLSLGVASKFTIGQVDTEYEPWEGDLGMDFRDDKHCLYTGGGYTEVFILVCMTHMLSIHSGLK